MRVKGLAYLDAENPKIIMFCGKGGVGKTTSAAATALHFAKKGQRVLLISTDPTPSLSDILERDVSKGITRVREAKTLDAVELGCETVIEMWKAKFGPEVYEVISSFLPVDEEIIEYVAGAPGIDEEFALSYVYDLYKSGNYDVIAWDTAPAGGTLSLIKLQDKFYRHLGEAARLYVRIRKALDTLVTSRAKRDPLKVIEEWERLAQNVLDMLKDERTHAIVVTIPEALGVNQTKRVIGEIESFEMRISKILVNYIITDQVATNEFLRERATMQRKYLEVLEKRYGKKFGVAQLPLLPSEVKGLSAIKEVERLLF
ncbi:MAG: ArsA family ATPase [Candidatus Bathyarchaeia archaeon]